MSCRALGASYTAASSDSSTCLRGQLGRKLHVSGSDKTLTCATLNRYTAASCRAPHDAHLLVLLLRHLHVVHFLTKFDQDLLQLLILVPLLLVLFLQ